MLFAFHILFAGGGNGDAGPDGHCGMRPPQDAQAGVCRAGPAVGAVAPRSSSPSAPSRGGPLLRARLLWPAFHGIRRRGSSACRSALEGFAFFTEAIFLGIYLYGWRRSAAVAPRRRVPGGPWGGSFLACSWWRANAWDEQPRRVHAHRGKAGGRLPAGGHGPNPAWKTEAIHMTLPHSPLRGSPSRGSTHSACCGNRERLPPGRAGIALSVGGVAAVLQPLSGDMSARFVAGTSP